MILIRKAIA